jgi:hypothetical protein
MLFMNNASPTPTLHPGTSCRKSSPPHLTCPRPGSLSAVPARCVDSSPVSPSGRNRSARALPSPSAHSSRPSSLPGTSPDTAPPQLHQNHPRQKGTCPSISRRPTHDTSSTGCPSHPLRVRPLPAHRSRQTLITT